MQYGHDHLCGGSALLRDDAGRYSPTIIGDGNCIVGMYDYLDVRAEPGQRFIDRIINRFKNHMVKACTIVGVPDIHAGTLTHRLEAFEDLDAVRIVRGGT